MAEVEDPSSRADALLRRGEGILAAAFLSMVARVRAAHTLSELTLLIERGQLEVLLSFVDKAAQEVAQAWAQAYGMTGEETAAFLTSKLGSRQIVVTFDRVNQVAVSQMRDNQLRILRELTQGQKQAIRDAIVDGIRRGASPIEQARAFRQAIGLTSYQVQVVENYRRALESGQNVRDRALRDRRFDRTVERARANGTELSPEQVEAMVQRYRERWLKHRAESIARTEALRAVQMGLQESYRQAIAAGEIDATWLSREWATAGDERVRHSHEAMQGQKRPWGVPFVSGAGFLLMHPGDPSAPIQEVAECRCSLGVRIQIPSSIDFSLSRA